MKIKYSTLLLKFQFQKFVIGLGGSLIMSRHDGGENCPGWCGRFEIFMVALVFSVGFSILWCCCTTKRDQENLEMIEGQDQVIKT